LGDIYNHIVPRLSVCSGNVSTMAGDRDIQGELRRGRNCTFVTPSL